MKTRVSIKTEVYRKIMHFVHKSDVEVSGLGMLEVIDGVMVVTDAIMLPQKNTASTTDIEPEHVAKAMFLLRGKPGRLAFWWHSHVNMGVFWSGTDQDTIKKLSQGGYFLSIVFNKKNEMRAAISMGDPIELFLDEVPIDIVDAIDPETLASWDAEYELNALKAAQPIWERPSGLGEPLTERERARLSRHERKRARRARLQAERDHFSIRDLRDEIDITQEGLIEDPGLDDDDDESDLDSVAVHDWRSTYPGGHNDDDGYGGEGYGY